MKAAILGYHPDLYPGFNALMTANIAYGLTKAGAEVTVLLPETHVHPQRRRIAEIGGSEATLYGFGVDLEYRVIDETSTIGTFDLAVWQSYYEQDEVFWDLVRKSAAKVAKNFPRLLTGDQRVDEPVFVGATARFDIVGLALASDLAIARRLFAESHPDAFARLIYMPRGFRDDWLSPKQTDHPILGLERGVDSQGEEYAYLKPVVERVRQVYPDLRVLGARLPVDDFVNETVPMLSARAFCRQFLSRLTVYAMINVDRSRQSMNKVIVDGQTIYPGLYENQIVEAQMAGAAVVGHRDALPEELVASPAVGHRFETYGHPEPIAEFIIDTIRDRQSAARTARRWALENHSVSQMTQPLISAAVGHAGLQSEGTRKVTSLSVETNRDAVVQDKALLPRMTANEIRFFEQAVSGAKAYLEFGCGGSTLIALRAGVRQIVSVESDREWIEKLKGSSDIAAAMSQGKLQFLHVNIGELREWGAPANEERIKDWVRYYKDVWKKSDIDYQIVFIDGRFRVACALASRIFIRENTKIMIHDYVNRFGYSIIEKYYNRIDESDTLALFEPKQRIDYRLLFLDIMDNLYDYS